MTAISGRDTLTNLVANFTLSDPTVSDPPSVPFGATLAQANTVSQGVQWYNAWSALVDPIGLAKVYFQNKGNPPPTSVSAGGAEIGALAQLGIPTVLCFEPTYWGSTNDSNWPGGADKPALGTYAAGHSGTILGDQFDMVATINGLKGSGLNVIGACMWQELDNFSKYVGESGAGATTPTADQITYLYFKHYSKLHSTGIPVIASYGGYQQNLATANQATTLMPFRTYLRPNDTNYCDVVTIDRYADGYHNLGTTPYSQGPGNVPTASQRWGYADMADFAGLGFGWIEAGNSANPSDNPDQQYMTAYISDDANLTPYPGDPVNSIQACFRYRMENNLPNFGFAWYQNNNNTGGANLILQAGDFRIPLLQSLYQMLQG